MATSERLKVLGERAASLQDSLETEEATKNALIMPFIQSLGYDVFNPKEVVPEFTADVGIKKGEKVDYAIMLDGAPAILFECKHCASKLDKHGSQLFRYFTTVSARLAILTNGISYRFYTDLRSPNRMDEHPFFEFDITKSSERTLELLEKISKGSFDIEALVEFATVQQDRTKVKARIRSEFAEPSDAFVRSIIDPIHDGRMTQQIIEKFRPLVLAGVRDIVSERVEKRLQDALGQSRIPEDPTPDDIAPELETEPSDDSEEIVTTVEELEGFFSVKSMLRDLVDAKRVTSRDVRSYFGILLDDNNRKPICRLWFNREQKYLGVFDAGKKETRIPIGSIDELYEHADAIRESLKHVL